MSARLARRGPDDKGEFFDGPVALGHRRLAIIDLSERAHQPMLDTARGLGLVFNGTIYNFRALRQELAGLGHTFRSEGDTEVILSAYRQWGDDCLPRLQGMFAFALWDRERGRLLLARDRFGIKPLYYAMDGRRLRFASNPQALLAAGGVDTRIDAVALHHHFSLHGVVPAPRTVLAGIRKVEPATSLAVDTGGHSARRSYWSLRAERPTVPRSEDEWVEDIHDALRSAVEKRLKVADVPVGVLLSGGLDSSLLVGLLAEAGVADIRTFSIGFEDVAGEAGSEFIYSDQVVERFATRHRKYLIPNDAVLARLPEAVDQMAEPMVGQDAVAFFLLAEQVAREVKVVQSGQGADEVFGGYFWYPRMHADGHGTPAERFARYYFDRDHEEYLATVTTPYWGVDHSSRTVAERLAQPHADEFLDQVLRMDVTMLIVDDPVKRVDNMTMAWGLEARVPFLDQDVVERAAALPPALKLGAGGKYVLKRIARGLLPDAVIDRPKGYFPMPALKFVRGPFFDFMRDILNSEACLARGLYQRSYVERLLSEPEAHFTRLQGSKLWHLALLELWLQRNVDKVGITGRIAS